MRRSLASTIWILATLVFLLAALHTFITSTQADDSLNTISQLPQPEEALKKRIQFWVRVYSEFSSTQNIIHDAKYPEVIFEIFDAAEIQNDFTIAPKDRDRKIKKKLVELIKYYSNALNSIHSKLKYKKVLSDSENKIITLYKDLNISDAFNDAPTKKRVRHQLFEKEQFVQGLYYSGRYLKLMEQTFAKYSLPIEITRLPFVESSFNIQAKSKVGASGIWQFMRSTGKLFLKINEVYDERNDPLKATEAAAQLLKQNYEALRQWPLAITAYNHGRMGMMRASNKLETESLTEIINKYRSRSFGFASSNFYTEFMAALEVEKNSEKYFGKIERENTIDFVEIVLTDFVDLNDISTYSRIPLDDLIELNPSLSEKVVKGKLFVPAEFVLRIPSSMRDKFLVAYNQMPSTKKFANQKSFISKKF